MICRKCARHGCWQLNDKNLWIPMGRENWPRHWAFEYPAVNCCELFQNFFFFFFRQHESWAGVPTFNAHSANSSNTVENDEKLLVINITNGQCTITLNEWMCLYSIGDDKCVTNLPFMHSIRYSDHYLLNGPTAVDVDTCAVLVKRHRHLINNAIWSGNKKIACETLSILVIRTRNVSHFAQHKESIKFFSYCNQRTMSTYEPQIH